MNMDDLMKALNQAADEPSAKSDKPAGDTTDLGSLLGALGGGQQGAGPMDLGSLLGALGGGQQSAGPMDLGSLLGALGGGASAQGSDPLTGLLGGLMGGGSGSMGGSPFDALAQPLAEKLGISPQIASMVIMFLANALLGSKSGSRSGAAGADSLADVNDVVAMLDSGQIDDQALQGNSLVQDLSRETGLDQETAARSIGALSDMLGGQQGLESLLGS